MAYGSGLSTPYFVVKSSKNFWPSGGYWSGESVAIVTLTCLLREAGMPPSFSDTKPVSATPSGP